MDLKTLAQIDLNLLVVMQVLLEEGSVSGAAKRLFLTQSAVSKALGRLRDQFDDPLFTRTSSGMVATPKALQMREKLPALLSAMEGLVTPEQFQPQTAKETIRLAIGEHTGLLLLPPLIEALQKRAPGIKLQALNRVEHQLDRLTAGELDFAIHMQHQRYPLEFKPRLLFRSTQGLMVRQGHPLLSRPVAQVDPRELKFVRLILPDASELEFLTNIDADKRGMAEANTVFETSHVASAVEVIRRTDCVLPIPQVLSLDQTITRGTTWLHFNPFGEFATNYVLVSHARIENSSLHRWVAGQIQTVTAKTIVV